MSPLYEFQNPEGKKEGVVTYKHWVFGYWYGLVGWCEGYDFYASPTGHPHSTFSTEKELLDDIESKKHKLVNKISDDPQSNFLTGSLSKCLPSKEA